ncbi:MULTISPECIES: cupin domain-containing protein [Streptomyces]|uniref:Cupin n=1 Tax=Streptomyces canarius TaxID=285453 RepID=A0ABQ3D353_9ACTN|nr:cupin domain-containing protein [Streptomyces canarius]ALO99369.1 cupin [Streptomyces hygroscopicus subsp. limoneus]GHA53245.1 cupin [Streptomyces canarius]
MTRNLVRAGLAAAAVAGLSLSAAAVPASATPAGPGVTGTIISKTTIGSKDYILRRITLPPGQSTGWHYHDGTLIGYVEQGTLSHFDASCASDGVYKQGHYIKEPAGADHVHIGRNLGTVPVVLDVLYVLPHGAPLSEDAPNPGCDFQ